MPKLPRAECHICHRDVAVRSNGDLREHNAWSRTSGRYEKCTGSGKKAVTDGPAT